MSAEFSNPERADVVKTWRIRSSRRRTTLHLRRISLAGAMSVSPSYVDLGERFTQKTDNIKLQVEKLERMAREKEEYLCRMEENAQTIEILDNKLQQKEYENTDLLMQLRREKIRSAEL